DRDQRAGVARLGRSGEPPLLVHQVQGEDAVDGDVRPLGDPPHLGEQVGRVTLDGRKETGRLDELRYERLRRAPEPERDAGVPALEEAVDALPQRLAVTTSALPPVAAALDDRV